MNNKLRKVVHEAVKNKRAFEAFKALPDMNEPEWIALTVLCADQALRDPQLSSVLDLLKEVV